MIFPCGHDDPGVQNLQALGFPERVCGTCGCPETIPTGFVWVKEQGRIVWVKEQGRVIKASKKRR